MGLLLSSNYGINNKMKWDEMGFPSHNSLSEYLE